MMMYDAIIVGGGAVGLSLALVLGLQNYQVLIIEQQAPFALVEDFDAKTIALSYASKCIFESLQIWQHLQMRAIPIHQVMVSMKGSYGRTRLNTPDDYDALGYVVGAQELEQVLYKALSALPTVQVLRPAKVLARECTKDYWQVSVTSNPEPVRCKLLIASDGVQSQLRQEQQIEAKLINYEHFAIVSNVEIPHLPHFTAIERFLPNGAIALLPWQNQSATCVWTTTQEKMLELKMLDDNAFLQQCEQEIGKRLGKLTKCSARKYFPLTMNLASQQVSARFLLMGNAAHNLHPIAAQGFNLSLRDVWQIQTQIIKAKEQHCDIGCERFLQEYENARRGDQNRIIFATDKIARFMSGGPLPSMLRGMGISLFDCIKPLKRQFVQIAMGLP